MVDEGGTENDSKVSDLSLELMRPRPGRQTIKREDMEANHDDHWTHMERYKNMSGIYLRDVEYG